MKRILFPALLILLFSEITFSQGISPDNSRKLRQTEDSLKTLSTLIIQGITSAERFTADSQFTRMFVRALKTINSFNYPFDSLAAISKLVAPDSTFRIFTWQMNINDNVTRQHGAIQMKTKDGSLHLIPLIDKSAVIPDAADTIVDNNGWIGAVYYRIIEKKVSAKTFYTLLGYDENNLSSNKKIVEVLTFNDGHPLFGGAYFNFPQNVNSGNACCRLVMEYKKDASPRLNYDDDLQMIVYEHLISETGEPQKKYTYIPDGDYEGLQWKNGKWAYVEKVFTQKLKDGEAPVPDPIRDEKGNVDDSKLKNSLIPQSEEPLETGIVKPTSAKKRPVSLKIKEKNN